MGLMELGITSFTRVENLFFLDVSDFFCKPIMYTRINTKHFTQADACHDSVTTICIRRLRCIYLTQCLSPHL